MSKRALIGCLICLVCSAGAVAWIMGQAAIPVIAPSTVGHRVVGIHVRPLASEAVVEIEYVDFAGEPLEKRTLILKKADYPRVLVSKFVEAIDAGLAHNRSGVVGGRYDDR